jgi:hypothetical protein
MENNSQSIFRQLHSSRSQIQFFKTVQWFEHNVFLTREKGLFWIEFVYFWNINKSAIDIDNLCIRFTDYAPSSTTTWSDILCLMLEMNILFNNISSLYKIIKLRNPSSVSFESTSIWSFRYRRQSSLGDRQLLDYQSAKREYQS